MPLRSHLVELRNRVFKAAIFLLLGAVGGWFLYDPVLTALSQPIIDAAKAAGRTASINYPTVAGAFDMKVRVSVFIGVFISSPFWIYQLWAFITPGLTKRERRYALGFFAVSVPLFLSGSYLAFQAMPNFVGFLVSFATTGASTIIDAQVYLGFVMRLILTFGLSFLVPVLLVGVNFIGLLSGKTMLKGWRWVVVAAFTFAAIATPTPDVMSMFIMALPLLFLFFVAIGVSLLNDRRRRKKNPELYDEVSENLSDDEASAL